MSIQTTHKNLYSKIKEMAKASKKVLNQAAWSYMAIINDLNLVLSILKIQLQLNTNTEF